MPRPLPPSRGARGQGLGLEGCGELLCNEVWVGVAWLGMLVSSEVSSIYSYNSNHKRCLHFVMGIQHACYPQLILYWSVVH